MRNVFTDENGARERIDSHAIRVVEGRRYSDSIHSHRNSRARQCRDKAALNHNSTYAVIKSVTNVSHIKRGSNTLREIEECVRAKAIFMASGPASKSCRKASFWDHQANTMVVVICNSNEATRSHGYRSRVIEQGRCPETVSITRGETSRKRGN
jgi:hypothetical protein